MPINAKRKNRDTPYLTIKSETLQQFFSPGHCVWGEAEEGRAGDQVGDVDEVHEEDYLES